MYITFFCGTNCYLCFVAPPHTEFMCAVSIVNRNVGLEVFDIIHAGTYCGKLDRIDTDIHVAYIPKSADISTSHSCSE